MIGGIVALFSALPAFIQLLSQIGLVIEKIVKTSQTHQLNQWLTNLENTIDQLEAAKDAQEKLDAAQKIVDTIHGITARGPASGVQG